MAGTSRPMLPDDIADVEILDELDAGGPGPIVVVSKRRIRRRRRRLVDERHLFLVDVAAGGRPRRLTDGVVSDSLPRLSPDGSSVAFRRDDPLDLDAPAQLCTIDVAGGRVRTLAPKGADPGFSGIDELAWSPDGRRLAFTASVGPARWIVGDHPAIGSKAGRDPSLPSPVARRITRTDWRWDETGHVDHWSHLFVVEVARGAAPRQVTSGDWGVSGITWHPDGRTVGFVSDRGDEPDVHPRTTIWAVDVDAGPRSRRARPTCVLDAAGGATRPAFSPDGRWLAAVGLLVADPLDDLAPGLLLGPADGSRPAVALSPELDRPIGDWTDCDLTGWTSAGRYGPVWRDERTIVAVVTDRGRSLPERWLIDPRSGALVDGPRASGRSAPGPWAESVTHAVDVTGAGEVVVLATDNVRGMEVMGVDLDADPTERRFATRTSFGTRWQRRFVQPEMRRVEAAGRGGPIETWIASPPGSGEAALPTIVAVHGGPLGGWAPTPHIETTILSGAGYRVVCPNIRGGAGYGADWIRPQLGDWGGVDADDVHAALDHVIELGLADPSRLGVFGLSYGGFMVNWLVGTSDRFGAAVSENGVTNQVSAWANSDSGPEYCRASLLGDTSTAEGVAKLWRQSPLRHVADVRTPLLLLQGEADLRCPPHDNEQFFIALRRLGRTVEYVLYPDSYHVYGYAGRPDRRIDRMHRVLNWFDTHLAAGAGTPVQPADSKADSKADRTSRTRGTRRVRS